MLFLSIAVLLLQSRNGQSVGKDRINQEQPRGFPLVLPEKDINPYVEEEVIANAVQNFAQDTSIALWEKHILGNVVFSPLSMETLLSLIMLGTRGVTYSQLKHALFFHENHTESTIHESFQYILGRLETASRSVKLDISSAMFVQKGTPISLTYRQIAQSLYDANVVEVDFKNHPFRSTTQINQYVRKSTGGKIPQILKSTVSPESLMIAVNTIIFHGPWQFPFNKDYTRLGAFDTGAQKKNVEMMSNTIRIPFIRRSDLGFNMVSLPYLESDLSLYILTPVGAPGVSSLQNLENGLSLISLDRLIGSMKSTLVDLSIPKMKLQFRHNLNSYLKELGATAIFDSKRSNFGRMTPNDFALHDVIHEAVLEITETGTIAAAVTAGTITRLQGKQFRVDKPSLLFIRDNSNGVILFWARVVDP